MPVFTLLWTFPMDQLSERGTSSDRIRGEYQYSQYKVNISIKKFQFRQGFEPTMSSSVSISTP